MTVLTAEAVWFTRLSRALGALPLADAERVRLAHEILRASATGEGSRGPTARALWDELGEYAGVGACPWSPDDEHPDVRLTEGKRSARFHRASKPSAFSSTRRFAG